MYIATYRLRVGLGWEAECAEVWRRHGLELRDVPGFKGFHLLRGASDESCTIFVAQLIWDSRAAFEEWNRSKTDAGAEQNIYLGPPHFEGFDAVL